MTSLSGIEFGHDLWILSQYKQIPVIESWTACNISALHSKQISDTFHKDIEKTTQIQSILKLKTPILLYILLIHIDNKNSYFKHLKNILKLGYSLL